MIDSSIVRTAAIVICLVGLSQAAAAGASSDLNCSAREGHASLSPRACAAGSTPDAIRGPGICIGQSARSQSRPAPLTAVTMLKPAHQNLCLKASASAPLSHLALQAEP